MSYTERLDVRGKGYEEIAEYFSKVSLCSVELDEMPNISIGAMTFERVVIRVIGEEENVTKVVENFRLHFLTAGG